jgi:hypothetical protein
MESEECTCKQAIFVGSHKTYCLENQLDRLSSKSQYEKIRDMGHILNHLSVTADFFSVNIK